MSSRSLDKCWQEAQRDLDHVLERETWRSRSARENEKASQLLSQCYVKYILILRKLEECFEGMVHPQKRALIKKLLEGTMGRILEIKQDMVASKLCEGFHEFDVLEEFSLTPDDLVIPIPKYFRRERMEEINNQSQLIDEIQARYGLLEEKAKPFVSTPEEAVLLIQRMERARQGRQRTQQMRDSYSKKSKEKQFTIPSGQTPVMYSDPNSSATKIQRVWKGYSTWQKIQREREEEMLFLGMTYLPAIEDLNKQRSNEIFEERLQNLQISGEQECYSAFIKQKDKIYRDQGDMMKENVENEIRNWFFTYKERAGKFPDYPSDEEGGYRTNLLTDVDQIILAEQEEEKIRLHKEKKASRTDKQPSGSQSKIKANKKVTESEETVKKKPSNCLPMLLSSCDSYKNVWEQKLSQSLETFGAPTEKYEDRLINESAKAEVEIELKKQVDMLMRQELQLLKLAYFKDKGKKGKKLKAAMKDKKKKTKLGKRKRKEKDVPGRSVESLFEELVRENVIKKTPVVNLRDYIGEDNLGPKVEDDICPVSSPADVRRILTEYCILPMGCPSVHSKCQLVRSLLLVGPQKCGKTMLVHSICTELGATFIDLSASNLVGKYSSREDLRIMFNMVSKVGRAMQPSVILVEDADLMFIKSLAKVDKTDPKRLKKGLQKLIKWIGVEDLIIVIGTARRPFDCDMKALASTYDKIIMLPRPDHSSRNTLWKSRLRALGGNVLSAVDFGNLVKVSDGYTSGVIVNCAAQVLSSHRVALQKKKPLQLEEFVTVLSKMEPVYKEEEEAFKLFSQRTPLAKKRAAALEPEETKKAREKLLSKKRKQMEDGSGKKKRKSKKRH